jgi:hypothetical protein
MTRRGLLSVVGAAALMALSLWPAQASAASPTTSPATAQQLRSHGYLPTIPNFAAVKAQAGSGAPAQASIAPAAAHAPVASPSFQGQDENDVAPSDSTGAIGPNSFIEAINTRFAIYSRAGALIASAPSEVLAGGVHGNLSDPQVMWDPGTNRFYFTVLDVGNNTLRIGFSKSSSPTHIPGDFCAYDVNFGYGANLPDFPKLGDTQHSLLIGVNVFQGGVTFIGSDIDFMTKPAGSGTISTCPAQSTFLTGKRTALKSAAGALVATPNPAQETDTSSTGWIVATPNTATGSSLFLFRVTENANGTPNIPQTATSAVAVAAFSSPPNAPQSGTAFALDTLDGRTLHAVTAIDPAHNALALWTAHAVSGGAGSEVRWYEVNVAGANLFQSGKATSSSLFAFNGTISPDRAVSGTTGHFGSNMVLGFTTSSRAAFPADQMVSKIGAGAQSAFVLVKASPGSDQGFDCIQLGFCRWGDYSGATPDPAVSSTATGHVWLVNMWAKGGGQNAGAAEWGTWNWGATP